MDDALRERLQQMVDDTATREPVRDDFTQLPKMMADLRGWSVGDPVEVKTHDGRWMGCRSDSRGRGRSRVGGF